MNYRSREKPIPPGILANALQGSIPTKPGKVRVPKTARMRLCAYCGEPAQGRYSIHETDNVSGAEVPLCDLCGDLDGPGVETIWAQIRRKKERGK